jgi:hypothetical protein
MSVSEKLQAFEADRKLWIEGELIPMRPGLKLLAALPKIVELVRAAETAYDGFGEDDHQFYSSQKRVVAALAALEEQLS